MNNGHTHAHGGLQAQEGQGQAQGDLEEIRKEHDPWPSPQARPMSADGASQYVQQSVRMQNEIISGIILDIDKLRGMILQIHHEQQYMKRTFLGPQMIMPKPPTERPVSVPTKPPPRNVRVPRPSSVPQKLPQIPRPPTAQRPVSRAPRKSPVRPVMIF